MTSDEEWFRLRELSVRITKGTTPTKGEGFVAQGVNYIKSESITSSGLIDTSKFAFIDSETHEKLARSKLRAGNVLFSMAGVYLGKTAVVLPEHLPANTNQAVGIITLDESKADSYFIHYSLQSPVCRDWVLRSAAQSAQPNFNLQEIGDLRVPALSLERQREIASVLRSLDDRIDLLRQTNITLESIAQALFKSWFIDFDPVRAKAEGRVPEALDAATAALFPDELDDSALGLIPKGWHISTLAEHVVTERGLSYKGAGLCSADEGLPMHNLNSVLEGGDYKYSGIKHYVGDYKDRHIALAGDVIVANTEQGHEHRLIGFPAIVPARYARAIYSHHIYRVRLKPESALTTHVLYYTLMAPTVREQVIGCANGSTVNMLKKAGLEIPQFVCPSADVARAFEEFAYPLRQQMEANIKRSEVLTALRDALLPRLISGKLRLPEAQVQLEDCPA
ncbi:restriction endonuclease subunit S [Variovorax sp. Varisp41]|uniref:restriction endonuclease subunit S n=1 Tax=Variovorax sp. Varisp41 TaxID=3243033 RepID=UPI0039B5D640